MGECNAYLCKVPWLKAAVLWYGNGPTTAYRPKLFHKLTQERHGTVYLHADLTVEHPPATPRVGHATPLLFLKYSPQHLATRHSIVSQEQVFDGSCERSSPRLLYKEEDSRNGFIHCLCGILPAGCTQAMAPPRKKKLVQTKLGTLFSVTAPPSHSAPDNTTTKRSEVSYLFVFLTFYCLFFWPT